MAKNLKLNIKNTQLAEALKLNKLKKPSTSAKKNKSTETENEEKVSQGSISREKDQKTPSSKEKGKEQEQIETSKVELEDQVKTSKQAKAIDERSHPNTTQEKSFSEEKKATFQPPKAPVVQKDTSIPETRAHAEGHTSPPQQRREYPNTQQRPPSPPRKDFRQQQATPSKEISPPSRDAEIKKPIKTQVEIEEEEKAARKSGPFKEYCDLKPQRKIPDKRAFDSRDRQGLRDSDDEQWRKRRPSKGMQSYQEEIIIRPKQLSVRIPITIKDLASEMKLKSSQLVSKLFMQGMVLTLNDYLDDETTIQLLGHEFDCEITIDTAEERRLRITEHSIKEEIQESPSSDLVIRSPVVAFMGHVDHGKTSLIDAIRTTNMASGEAGAITQHIGAFKCHTPVGDITILDTPGHEAFSAMRTRGADVTDIIVLVIAGDEGLRTQTLEAIQQAQTANVPIVVAINKSDKPNFNAENIYRQLADQNLLPEAWGGTIITVNCSAATGDGIKQLLEMLALQAEILELRS